MSDGANDVSSEEELTPLQALEVCVALAEIGERVTMQTCERYRCIIGRAKEKL